MKHVYLVLLAILSSIVANGQEKWQFRAFSGAVYGSDVQQIGVNLGIEYLVTSKIGLAPNFSYYFVDSGSFISLDLDGRYYFLPSPQIYGLLGIVVERAELDIQTTSVSDSEAGIDLGAGIILPLGQVVGFMFQIKLATPGKAQAVIQAGLNFNF